MSKPAPLAERVVAAFGSLTKMQRALGHKHPTTIDAWTKSKHGIPSWRLREVREAAAREGVKLPADFPDQDVAA